MNILDPKFKYIPAARTSVAATFKRIRKEQALAAKKLEAEKQPLPANVEPLKKQRQG